MPIKNKFKIEETESEKKYLNKKTKRTIYKSNLKNLGNRCSICLEYDKYSEQKSIKCNKCNSYFHLKCYNLYFSENNFKNEILCENCKKNKNGKNECKCILCGDEKGIMKNIENNIYAHIFCIRYFKELNNTKIENFRIWRFNSKCKICKSIIKNIPVIKCNNTKCKNYYHIKCAIQMNLIFSLSYQEEFFKIKYNELLPFYCNNHNIHLIKDYQNFIDQIDSVMLEDNINENSKSQKTNENFFHNENVNCSRNENLNNKEIKKYDNEILEKNLSKFLEINPIIYDIQNKMKFNNSEINLKKNEDCNKTEIYNIKIDKEEEEKKDNFNIKNKSIEKKNELKIISFSGNINVVKKNEEKQEEGKSKEINNEIILKENEENKLNKIKEEFKENDFEKKDNSKNNKENTFDYKWTINLGLEKFSSPINTPNKNIDIFQLYNQINKNRIFPVYIFNRNGY